MVRLIICGNGFDIHHNLKTMYADYHRYLNSHASYVLKEFEKFPWFNISCGENLWSDLENTLAIDLHKMVDFYKEHYCDENGNIEYQVDFEEWTRFIYSFTGEKFYEWISSIAKDATKDVTLESLFNNSVCITFNYTDTIERLYGVANETVLHIHGSLKAIRDNECFSNSILPSFISIEDAEVNEKPIVESDIWNSDIIRDELQFGAPLNKEDKIYDIFNSIPDENIRKDFNTIVEKTTKKPYKNGEKLIKFLGVRDIDEVVILGASLSGADEFYYHKYFVPMFKKANWIAYVYNENDKFEKEEFFKRHGIIPKYKEW